MKIQLKGYADEKGNGTPVYASGAADSRDSIMKIWDAAKRLHKFPKGVIRLELERVEDDPEIAIFVGDHVAEEQQAFAESNEARMNATKDAKVAKQKAIDDLAKAAKAVSTTAVSRNDANSVLNAARVRLDAAKEQAALAKRDFPKSKIDEETVKRFDDAQKAFEAADKAWVTAKETLAALKNPKTGEVKEAA